HLLLAVLEFQLPAMARDQEPLLVPRPSSELSGDRNGVAEEDELLTGRRRTEKHTRGELWRRRALYAWATIATFFVIILAVLYENARSSRGDDGSVNVSGKRNLVFMISDGMGPTALSLTRTYRQYSQDLPYDDPLTLDKYVIGQARTRSTSSLVTDSAAGATAFTCGRKSYNGAISVLPDHSPCGTVMEAAKSAGYMTGLVVTTRITDATPACFASHVNKREEQDLIAEQLLGDSPLGRTVDLMFGAGRCYFLPNTTEGGCRSDDQDLLEQAKKQGFTYIDTKRAFNDLQVSTPVKLPLLGLFAKVEMPFEIDRKQENDRYPSLEEMTKTALQILSEASKASDKGFFLMVEGSRIDHAAHANDPVAEVQEVLAYDAAFEAVLNFLDRDVVPGIAVSTSDHETGGLATAKQLRPYEYPAYLWHPSALANASHSVEWLCHDYSAHRRLSARSDADTRAYLEDALSIHLGIQDCTSEEMDLLVNEPHLAPYTFGEMLSRRSQTGWSTHGHSAADVNIYSSDFRATEQLMGSRENTEVGDFLRDYLDVESEMAEVTKKLRANMGGTAWLGQLPEKDERLDGQSHEAVMDHYSADRLRFAH
ncbi:MAG: hypothetical protein M1828_007276, partial [Chrysothrix sp. TS-e1954]